jgi:uncharacterized membrane protein
VILSVIGFILLFHSIKLFIKKIDEIILMDLVSELMLTPILSMLFIIFAYLAALYSSYELVFIRLDFYKTIDNKLRN